MVATARRIPDTAPDSIDEWRGGRLELKAFPSSALIAELTRRVKRDVTIGDLTLHPATHQVTWRGALVTLTGREYQMLTMFVVAHPIPLPYIEIQAAIWGPYADENTARLYAHYLRRKLPGLLSFAEGALPGVPGVVRLRPEAQ